MAVRNGKKRVSKSKKASENGRVTLQQRCGDLAKMNPLLRI